MGGFVATVLGLCGVMKLYYPDKISVPKSYEDGLEAELGGPRAVRVSVVRKVVDVANDYRQGHMVRRSTGSMVALYNHSKSSCTYEIILSLRSLWRFPQFRAISIVNMNGNVR